MCRGSSIIGRAEEYYKRAAAIEAARRKVYILRYDRHTKNHYCNVIVSLVSRRVSRKEGKAGGKKAGGKRDARRIESEERLNDRVKLIEILNYCTKLSAGSS